MKCLSFATVLVNVALATVVTAQEKDPEVEIVVGSRLSAEKGTAPANDTRLTAPFGVDFDTHDNMYIVELKGGRVHRLTPDGRFSTIAGDGSRTYSGDGGPALKATFNGMHNVAISPTDHIFIADSWNYCIRRIDAVTGTIRTFAGTGKEGFSGDEGPARDAAFTYVMCITFDPSGQQLYIADINNLRIRVIDMERGIVRTIAGNGEKGVPRDGDLAVDCPLVDPRAVTADANGNVYVLERGGHALRVVTPDGLIRTIAGTGKPGLRDGPALQAELNAPKHMCLDDQGRVIIADDQNHAIRRYDPISKTVTTILGHAPAADSIRLKNPHGVTFEKGRLYVVDMGHDRVLRVK